MNYTPNEENAIAERIYTAMLTVFISIDGHKWEHEDFLEYAIKAFEAKDAFIDALNGRSEEG